VEVLYNIQNLLLHYRKLNKLTKKDPFPWPRIDDLLDSLEGQCFFSSLDCFSGYWQIPLEKKSREMSAFATPTGIYHFIVMLLVCAMLLLIFVVLWKRFWPNFSINSLLSILTIF